MTIVVIRASIRISAITSCIVPISSPCPGGCAAHQGTSCDMFSACLMHLWAILAIVAYTHCCPGHRVVTLMLSGDQHFLTDWLGSDIRFFYPILAADILVHHTTARVAVGAAFMVSHTTTRVHVGRSCNINTMDHCRAAESVDCPTLTPKRRCGNTFSITLISGDPLGYQDSSCWIIWHCISFLLNQL